MKILFKITSRSRPILLKRTIDNILSNITNGNYHILITLDTDDSTSIEAIKDYFKLENITVCFGKSFNKVHAINRDIQLIGNWDILVNVSDDQVFTIKGFDEIIRLNFDNLNNCLHIPDGNRNDLITMAIIGRKFYNRFGYIYNPEYKSLYCDNEMTEVSKLLRCYKFVNENIMLHLHPAFGKGQYDQQYILTESFSNEDCQTFLKRKANNFDLVL